LNQADGETDALAGVYAAVAAKRWLGQKPRFADVQALHRSLTSRILPEQVAAINASFLLCDPAAAESAFAKALPVNAFAYFESLERIPEALKSLGLDPEHPAYAPWVEQRVKKLAESDIENQRAPSTHNEELIALANFLEGKGLHQEAMDAFSAPLAAFAERDVKGFLNFLGQLFTTYERLPVGAPRLARSVGVAWAGDDEKRWEELFSAAFGEDDLTQTWWNWLAELAPKASRSERFDAMLALFHVGADPTQARKNWLALAWQAVTTAPARDGEGWAARISSLCLVTGDVANSLKAWELLPDGAHQEVFWHEHILHLSATQRWNEVATILLHQIALSQEAKQDQNLHFHAYAAAALRQAGRLDEAATHDRWVDQLALGNPALSIQIGNGYAFGNDYVRAGEWWARATREADPESDDFAIALKLHSDNLLASEQWLACASTSEVLAHIYVSQPFDGSRLLARIRQRLQADTAHALTIVKADRPRAIAILQNCHHAFASDGSLADFFFPALRKAGLIKEHDEWFRVSWSLMENSIATFPESDNTRNTAAWFASRALKNLDQAEKYLSKALAINPTQSTYLDTMAEIQFAMGKREKALEWSRKAVNFMPKDVQLRQQQERFRAAPLPQ
jgi:tetratricopeptide (TPR) repeat protein